MVDRERRAPAAAVDDAPLPHEETLHICGACGAEAVGGWPPCDVFTTTLLQQLEAARAKLEVGHPLTAPERELLEAPAHEPLRQLARSHGSAGQPEHQDPPREGYPTPEWVRHNLDHPHPHHRAHAEKHPHRAG
jgi:hypothetical protein